MRHHPTLNGSVNDPDYWITCSCGWVSNDHLTTNDAAQEFNRHQETQTRGLA